MTERTSPEEDIDLTPEEWDDIVKRLLIVAKRLVPNDAIRGLAAGPKDLVQETIRRLWDPATTVKWNSSEFGKPTVPKVVGFLRKVLTRQFLDLLKKGEYKFAREPLPDNDGHEEHDHALRYSRPSPANQLVSRVYLEQLCTRTRALAVEQDDVEVAIYLDLQMCDGPYTNTEAAQKLGVAPADIVNIRKRLNRLGDRVSGSAGRT